MVQQLGPYLAFEPWTWGIEGIAGYQQRVIQEDNLYSAMKKEMTLEERKHYDGLISQSNTEKLGDSVADWGRWTLEGGKSILGLSKKVKMVPVPPENIRDPDTTLLDKNGKPIQIRWAISDIRDSYTTMYKTMSDPVDRKPGESHDRSREDGKLLTDLGRTNEYIHPAVWWRYKTMQGEGGDKIYRSRALEGFKRRQDPKYGSWGYLKGKVWIPEWFMKPTNMYLTGAGHHEYVDAQGDEPWQHAEWTYTDNVSDCDDMQPELAQFYVDAQHAKKKMGDDKREFPFEVQL